VVPYCHARRVLIQAGRATGVEVERFGRRELYTATREVILSAGKRYSTLQFKVDRIHLDREMTEHRLNRELDLQSLFGLMCTAVPIG
jgi:hypothetical protein